MLLNGAGTYTIPSGTCRLQFTSTVALNLGSGVTLQGQGMLSTILNFRPNSATGRQLFNIGANANNVGLSNLGLTVSLPPGTQTIQGIRVQSGNNTNFYANRVYYGGAQTASTTHSYYAFSWSATGAQSMYVFDSCRFESMSGVFLKGNLDTSIQSGVIVRDCYILDAVGGLNFNSPSALQQDLLISGNTLVNTRNMASILSGAISVARGTNIVISNNIFRGIHWTAIHIEDITTDFVIEGNTVSMTCNANTGTCFGISIQDGGPTRQPSGGVVSNNVVEMRRGEYNSTISAKGIALIYDNTAADAGRDITIAENIVQGWKDEISAFVGYQHEGLPTTMVSYIDNEALVADVGYQYARGSILSKLNRSYNCTVGLASPGLSAGNTLNRFVVESHVFSLCATSTSGIGVALTQFSNVLAPVEIVGSSSTSSYLMEANSNVTFAGQLTVAMSGSNTSFATYYYANYYVTWNASVFSSFALASFGNQYITCAPTVASEKLNVACNISGVPVVAAVKLETRFSGLYVQESNNSPLAQTMWSPFNLNLQCSGATCSCTGGDCTISVLPLEERLQRLEERAEFIEWLIGADSLR